MVAIKKPGIHFRLVACSVNTPYWFKSLIKNFSLILKQFSEAELFTRCSLLVEIHSLLVTHCKTTRYSLQNLFVTRCRSCSLQKITRYPLQNSLVNRCRSCSLQEITRYSLQKIAHYLLQSSLITRCRSCSLQKITCYLLQNLPFTRCSSCSLQKITQQQQNKLNKDTIEILVIYILPMDPLSLTLSTLLLPVQKPSR